MDKQKVLITPDGLAGSQSFGAMMGAFVCLNIGAGQWKL